MATLNFKGKPFIQNYHLSVKYHELIPQKSKSLTDKVRLTDNLIIHGDNLKALKALLPTYAGKVKCIYIDPPYNTGNEKWVYNDNVNSPMMQEWLGKVVDREDLTRHDKWLCMMMPRIKLLREMLRDDGAIFISIDDNEIHHLMCLMNEIFGEENFKNVIIIRRGVKSVQAQFSSMDRLAIGSEYILVYTKNSDYRFPIFNIELEESKTGSWNNHWRGTDRPTMRYELFGIKPKSGQWRWGKDRSLEAIENYKCLLKDLGKKESEIGQEDIDKWYLQQLAEGDDIDLLRLSNQKKPEHYVPPSDTKFASSLWADLKPNGSSQVKRIFGKKVFENPKSTDLIKRLIQFSGAGATDIILDSFAGTGTTGHAVLEMNEEDSGQRKFVLVQCDEYDRAKGEVTDICNSVTAERIRRIINSMNESVDLLYTDKTLRSFSYFELGRAIELEHILDGKHMPTYEDLARYLFYTATGEEFDEKQIDEKKGFIGESQGYEVYLFYQPEIEVLKRTALTLDRAKALGKYSGKRRLVFAPTKFMDQDMLDEMRIDFAQLPFEIYKFAD